MSRPAFEGMSAQELERRIDEYFTAMDEQERPYTVEGLCCDLGVGKDTLIRYRQHEQREGQDHVYDEHCEAIKRAYARCERYLAERLHSGKGSPVGQIFALKCGYGWQETPTRIEAVGGFTMLVDTSAADADDES